MVAAVFLASIEQTLGVARNIELGAGGCSNFGLRATFECDFAGGVEVSVRDRSFEFDDVGGERLRRLLLVGSVIVFELGAEFREELGGNFCASRETTDLRVLGLGAEGVLRAGDVGGTGFARADVR